MKIKTILLIIFCKWNSVIFSSQCHVCNMQHFLLYGIQNLCGVSWFWKYPLISNASCQQVSIIWVISGPHTYNFTHLGRWRTSFSLSFWCSGLWLDCILLTYSLLKLNYHFWSYHRLQDIGRKVPPETQSPDLLFCRQKWHTGNAENNHFTFVLLPCPHYQVSS